MDYYAGIDVSWESSSLCVVDATGRIVREAKVASEPEALTAWFNSLGFALSRIGLEAGPMSQWLYAATKQDLMSVACRKGDPPHHVSVIEGRTGWSGVESQAQETGHGTAYTIYRHGCAQGDDRRRG